MKLLLTLIVLSHLLVICRCRAQSNSDANLVASGQNLAEIGIALHNYDIRKKTLPLRFLKTADGQPGLSWRVQILPQLGHKELEELYEEFHLDEPWDSPNNRSLVDKMPDIYKSSRGDAPAGHTNYLAVTGDDAPLREQKQYYHGFRDGTSNTIAVVEVDDEHAVEWTCPEDFVWLPAAPAKGLGFANDPRFLALMVDSSVQLLPNTVDPKDLATAYTGSGGEAPGTLNDHLSKEFVDGGREFRSRRHHFDLLREAIRKSKE